MFPVLSVEILTALVTFGFVASITPGPNNLMLMASGANFGVRRSLPHFVGIVLGFALMVLLVGTGLAQIFDAWPASYEWLRWFSLLYLTWLAWKIATAVGPGDGDARGRPMTWLQAALFQWVNPKAWALALTAVTAYAPAQDIATVSLIALILGLVNTPSIFVWILLGDRLRHWLDNARRLRWFNAAMALLLLGSLYPVLVADFA